MYRDGGAAPLSVLLPRRAPSSSPVLPDFSQRTPSSDHRRSVTACTESPGVLSTSESHVTAAGCCCCCRLSISTAIIATMLPCDSCAHQTYEFLARQCRATNNVERSFLARVLLPFKVYYVFLSDWYDLFTRREHFRSLINVILSSRRSTCATAR